MKDQFYKNIDEMFEDIEMFIRLQREYQERTLAEIITKYDFLVGSIECKYRLAEMIPEGANIICTPYIHGFTIYAIKKFDVIDLLYEPQEREGEK